MNIKVEEFKIGDYVVYPSHGVGEIIKEESQNIAGKEFSVYVILILSDKLTVQVPTNRVKSSGLRHLSTIDKIYQALDLFKSKSKANRALWSKRAQEYEGKINSGNIFSIAEVLRDLHKNSEHPERSYSERAIYESAFFRLAKEISLVKSISLDTAKSFLADNLSQNDFVS